MRLLEAFIYFTFIFSFSLFLFIGTFFLWGEKPVHETQLYAWANVSTSSGLDLTSDSLAFGVVQKPGSATRFVTIRNDFSFPLRADIRVRGTIAPLLHFGTSQRIAVNQSARYAFSVIISDRVKEGFYDGQVSIRLFQA